MGNTEKKTGANAVGHNSALTAVLTGLIDLFGNRRDFPPLDDGVRLEGKTILITGANSGLGKAVAIDLARRGARVIMACRSGIPEAGEEVKIASGSSQVEMLPVDLSDLASVAALCDTLRDRQVKLDITILNAGLMPLNARKSLQGYELMFAVHFLGNRLFLERCLKDGVISQEGREADPARIIFVASEAHQSSDPIDFNHFGEFVPYGVKDGLKHYGITKLHMVTHAIELSRRLNPGGQVKVAVHALCPGPIASNIARESPAFIKVLLSPIMRLLFRSPEVAAEPVVYLACSADMGKRTGSYLHMMREKLPSVAARDEASGRQLWEKSAGLLHGYLQGQKQ